LKTQKFLSIRHIFFIDPRLPAAHIFANYSYNKKGKYTNFKMMMMIAFITFKSSLVPLLEGL